MRLFFFISVLMIANFAFIYGGADKMSKAEAAKEIAGTLSNAADKSAAKLNALHARMEKKPKSLMNAESMEKAALAGMLNSPGNKELSIQASQGFNGHSNFQPPSMTIKQMSTSSSSETHKKDEHEENGGLHQPFYYPHGLGPLLMNGCTGESYGNTSPCFNSKQYFLQKGQCNEQLDAGNFIGVGFNGRGYYSSESRRSSLVQRTCAAGSYFLDAQVPDNMNCYGIYDTKVETKSYQSLDDYMKHMRESAGVSDSSSMFHAEAEKMSKSYSAGGDFGMIGGLIGAAAGAYAGKSAEAASAGASVGSAIGSSIGFHSGHGHGKSNSKKNGRSKASFNQQAKTSQQQSTSKNFIAVMSVDILLFEIALDEVTPEALSLAFLKDYIDLPRSYFTRGAVEKYQNFLVRWGTHYIRSAKMGGQLRITKTSKNTKKMTGDQFSSVAQSEFSAMFANLKQSHSQKESGWSFLGFGEKKTEHKQKASYKHEAKSRSKVKQTSGQKVATSQSDFTQTTVEAIGGDPQIANAVIDFYTPSFRETFSDWIKSIFTYPKPISFTLKGIDELLNIRMASLFPEGSKVDMGCNGKKKLFVDSHTKQRYYFTELLENIGNETVSRKTKVVCKYKDLKDFKKSFEERHLSLEKAISIYLKEGPTPISSYDLAGGKPGCESDSIKQARQSKGKGKSDNLHWSDLSHSKFYIIFDLPYDVKFVTKKRSKFLMSRIKGRWFTVTSANQKIHMYAGCKIPPALHGKMIICVNNLLLKYNPHTGYFKVTKKTFFYSRQIIRTLPIWLIGAIAGKVEPYNLMNYYSKQHSSGIQLAFPCNVKWSNTHKLNPHSNFNCIHFTAASRGNIFVIFAVIPKKISTWYYLQLSSFGVAFYKGGVLEKADIESGTGTLGDDKLYETYFTCIKTFKDGEVDIQFGKSEPGSELGKVHSAYIFSSSSKNRVPLKFYAFGAGTKKISFNDVRLASRLPVLTCPNDKYERIKGRCVLKCHAECKRCNVPADNTECHACKHKRVEHYVKKGRKISLLCVSKCPKGYEPHKRIKSMCIKCKKGYEKNTNSNEHCVPCKHGSYASKKGTHKCHLCSKGTYCDIKSCKKCYPCAKGWFAGEKGRTECHRCFRGTHAAERGAVKCKSCEPGFYAPVVGLAHCRKCKAGTFSDKQKAKRCKRCPKGSTSRKGSSSCANDCKEGYYSSKILGSKCKPCPAGYYSPSAGSTKCTPCKPGTFSDSKGSNLCTDAPKGYFVKESKGTKAKPCPGGHYSNKKGQTTCKVCKLRTYSKKGSSKCKTCPPGTFSRKAGVAKCTPCPRGSHNHKHGMTACVKCAIGHYAASTGMKKCLKCPEGTFTVSTGTIKCFSCPKGKYIDRKGTTRCLPCKPGSFSNKKLSKKCSKCHPGTYSKHSGATKCTLCPHGSFSSGHGASECRLCPKGQYQNNKGSKGCSTCAAGHFADRNGMTACKKCPLERYQDRSGQSNCKSCDAGHHSYVTGSTSCRKARPFKYLGCYKDTGRQRDMKGLFNSGAMTLEKCRDYCKRHHYRFMGTQARTWCGCNNSYGRHGKRNNCNGRCPGNRSQYCGDNWRNSIYKISYNSDRTSCQMRRLKGKNYIGRVSRTKSGRKCQKWTYQYPHRHDYMLTSLGNHNYCRNTLDNLKGVWCLTTDRRMRWEYCNVPYC